MGAFFEHFRFAQPGWLLLIVPILLLLLLRRGRGAAASVTFPNLGVLVSLGSRVRQSAWNLGLPLAFVALFTAIVTLARPVWRNEYKNRSASGIDIVLAFDTSLSMIIDDFVLNERAISRIAAAKRVVDDFISRRPDDRIGLIAFAGRPVSVCPLTLDHEWLRKSLDGLRLNDESDRGTVEESGTAIGSALAASAMRLDVRQSKSKVIVLITDGASNSGKISPLEAAAQAKELGIKIYTVAIGTKEGRVPGSIQAFPRQEFDLPTLIKIAKDTGGEHFWAQGLSDLEDTFRTINSLEKTEVKTVPVTEDIELFPWFLAIAVLASLTATVILALNPPPAP
ncbi:MAG: VWA domain-containing protein [Verrucomicrobia bacterium]|nr:VWA domain-containing protein [Verrucomicrobiota bacterium]